MRPLRFAAVGHVTNDTLEQGLFPGGSVLYAGLAARALGAEVTLVTSLGPDFAGAEHLETGLCVHATPAARTTHFEEREAGGRRVQRVTARAAPLSARPLEGDAVLVCPVVDEVEREGWRAQPGQLLGAGLQGWLRALDAEGRVSPRPLGDARFLAGFGVVFCSDEDLGDDVGGGLAVLRAAVPMLVMTEGARGARVFQGERSWQVPVVPTEVVDTTGAGDVFATCFLVGLAQGMTVERAGALAARGASVAISGVGVSSLAGLCALQGAEMSSPST